MAVISLAKLTFLTIQLMGSDGQSRFTQNCWKVCKVSYSTVRSTSNNSVNIASTLRFSSNPKTPYKFDPDKPPLLQRTFPNSEARAAEEQNTRTGRSYDQ